MVDWGVRQGKHRFASGHVEINLWDNVVELKGYVKITVNGKLVAEGPNLVVDTGKDLVAKLVGSSGVQCTHMAIGGTGSATQATMTELQGTEFERVALTGVTVASNVVTYEANFGTGISSTQTIREVGIFNAVVGGEMLCRFICSGFSLSPGESCNVQWSVTMGST